MAVAPLPPRAPGLGFDARSLDALRGAAARDPKAAVREAAKQFESLFMQELMKSMRSTTLASGMLDNEGSKLGTEMPAWRQVATPQQIADVAEYVFQSFVRASVAAR